MSPQTPQSLAAKRSKRTHRIPKRLLDDDFFPGDLTLPIARIKTTPSEAPPSAKKDETLRVVDQDSVAENVEVDVSLVTTRSNKAPVKETGDETSVIKKGSPFHPSITLSNGLRISKTTGNATTISSPLIEKPSTPTNIAKQVDLTPPSPKHKKSKGFSLMVKQSPLNQNQTQNSQQQIQQQQQQQTKYYNNFSQNMQYGTRLLLNEPIYLPRSVATIAPITTTLQQVATLYRDSLSITEPVFGQTKRAEAYLSYQKEGGLNYMTSYHTAIMKITKYLEVTDLLNLRLANKTWKSIIDNDEVWRKVVLKSCKIVDWKQFAANILSKHSTTELTFNDIDFDKGCKRNLERVIIKGGYSLKKLCFITKDMNSNQNVLAFLKKLHSFTRQTYERKFTIRCRWDVKVEVNPRGIAYVRLLDGINSEGTTLEFSDIEEKLSKSLFEPFVEMRMF